MAATTLPASTPRTDSPPRYRRMGAALAKWAAKGATMASAVRHRDRSPALTIGGLGFIDAGIWQHFHTGTGLIAIGVSILLYDFSREKP